MTLDLTVVYKIWHQKHKQPKNKLDCIKINNFCAANHIKKLKDKPKKWKKNIPKLCI